MTDYQSRLRDPDYVRRCFVSYVSEFALDPDEAFEVAKIGERSVHPSIFLDGMGELEIFYHGGWAEILTAEEREAIENYIECETALPMVEDTDWEDSALSNTEWQTLRAEARKLIQALGGLPEDFPGRWARK